MALLPTLSLPIGDRALAIRDVAEMAMRRRLFVVTRDGPTTPALGAFLSAVTDQARGLDRDATTGQH